MTTSTAMTPLPSDDAEVEALTKLLRQHIYVDATGLSPSVAYAFVYGFEEAARAALTATTAKLSSETEAREKAEAGHQRLWEKFEAALKAGAAEKPTEDGIAAAIQQTNYKYFGDYALSENQWDAVYLLINAARHFIAGESTIADLTRKLEAAAGALEPFSRVAEPIIHDTKEKWNPDGWIALMQKLTVGDFRRAREAHAALLGKGMPAASTADTDQGEEAGQGAGLATSRPAPALSAEPSALKKGEGHG